MPSARPPADLTKDVAGLAAAFLISGTTHLVRPQVFEPIVPRALPRRRELVYASGVVELLCAAGLLLPRTRSAAGLASAALLLAVFPANVQMAVTHGRRARRRKDAASAAGFAATLARLPLQWPMIRIALRAAGR
ncbi:MAG TPA: DoxX family protein [Dermatophilaceae bacterium]|nr:DoxX family protein [Dermatophilaceae bacterium]